MSKKKTKTPKKGGEVKGEQSGKGAPREVNIEELLMILERTKAVLSEKEQELLKGAVDTLAYLTAELEAKGASIKRLRTLLFGPSTERIEKVLGEGKETEGPGEAENETKEPGEKGKEDEAEGSEEGVEAGGKGEEAEGEAGPNEPKRRKGHGRKPASSYTGAQREKISHERLKVGETCPKCEIGKVYEMKDPAYLIRVKGMAPLHATVFELERLRCNGCGEVFTAQAPEGVGEKKYDETASSMIALLKYGCGLPFNRIEGLQESLGIPFAAGTQWDEVNKAYQAIAPAYDELICQAANGEVIHNDDTTMKILDLMKVEKAPEEKSVDEGESDGEGGKGEEGKEEEGKEEEGKERTGIFTSGIVSVGQGRQIAVFFTGRKHAGENLSEVLQKREGGLDPPIQMCDALSRNTKGTEEAGSFETVLANCMAHARRKFVGVVENFPEECRYVLETLRDVYRNDDIAQKEGMSAEERLHYHQEKSKSLMDKLKIWLNDQIVAHKVEPNSSLGQAIKYMLNHWMKLTLFLRVAGAPLDNNIVERALKKAILNRKNAYFYKTENGARVGDTFMSLIYTCELNGANPFDYLVALQRHSDALAEQPDEWMPWNYRETLERLTQPVDSSEQAP